MGLWQKLFGWLNPSAPTAATVADTPAHAAGSDAAAAPIEPGFEPHFPVRKPAAGEPHHADAEADALASQDAMAASPGKLGAQQTDLFDAAAEDTPPPPRTNDAAPAMSAAQQGALQDVLSVYAGMAWDRQLDFADKIGERPWTADISKGQIQFGDDLRFTMQVLGTYSFQSGTWQWIWANTQTPVDPAYTEVARQLLAFGNEQGLPLFTQPRSELAEEDLHQIGLIASGADESAGYYLGNYGEGIVLVVIDHGNGLPQQLARPERVLSVLPQLLSQFDLNHRLLLSHYLAAKGFVVEEGAAEISGQRGASRIVANLDDQGRISALNGSLG